MRYSRILLGLSAAATVLSAVTLPALGQEAGGRKLSVSLRQGLEAERNPDQTPGATDAMTSATTDLSFGISSETRGSALELVLNARLRAAIGDAAGDTLAVDRSGLGLKYSRRGPGARLDLSVGLRQQDIANLRAIELVEDVDGVLVIPEDLDDLQGTGTRTNASYRLAATFGENRPFGWGIALSGSELSYRDVTSSALVGSRSTNLSVTGRFDIDPVPRLDSRLGYALRDTDTTSETGTTTVDLGLTLARPADGALRARLGFAFPEDGADRVTVSAGLTRALTPQSRLGFDLGATSIDGSDVQGIGRLNYQASLTPTLGVSADLSRQVSESSSGDTTLATAGQIGLDMGLSRQVQLSVDATYVAQRTLGSGRDVSEATLSMQLDRKLDKDWTLAVGVAHTRREIDSAGLADSDRVFLNLGRDWNGKF